MIKEGERVKNFVLKGIDENGLERDFSLTELLKDKKYLIIYFYPKDDTPGCTTEACDFRDNLEKILPFAKVIGISADSIDNHKKFRQKHSLNFPLLSDPEFKVINEFGAAGEKILFGKKKHSIVRSTFIINSEGRVIKAWRNVKAKGHVDEVVDYLKRGTG